MNFQELRIIVGQIKKNVTCPKCKSHYSDEDIEIIGGLADEQHFFHTSCAKCETESVVNVSLLFDTGETAPSKLKKLGSAPRMGHISSNEVLDMHNFLKQFDGDFDKIFKKTE
ncbi:MAG: putative nucleic-acid-binding Zn-ribbon protein [Oceanicoccus sp.]|jgi:predicted nucleic-acid-binding Zn-ribbon protein